LTNPDENRFEDFFNDDSYVLLKNNLYNYALRKRAVRKWMQSEEGPILEVGSGLSPMLEGSGRIVYSDLSFSALKCLRKKQYEGFYIEADAVQFPFKNGSFLTMVCSEVIERRCR
jgi:ubiquinone/menaquinone biosynthesis C-methylase UbiE